MDRGTVGFQMVRVIPMIASIRPTVTMSCTTREAKRSLFIRSRSSATPTMGARTKMTTNSASGAGQCLLMRSSQYTKARKQPMAPWAKLNTPVVEYVTTSPPAEMA